jgi:hypothetical protein
MGMEAEEVFAKKNISGLVKMDLSVFAACARTYVLTACRARGEIRIFHHDVSLHR